MLKKIYLFLLCLLMSTTTCFAGVWTYEANNGLNVVWDKDNSEYYNVSITDMKDNSSKTYKTFNSEIKIEGLLTHHIYKVVVYTASNVLGTEYVCYNINSVAITVNQDQLNNAVEKALPTLKEVNSARVVVGDAKYIGYVEVTNTTSKAHQIKVNVGSYSVAILIQPFSAWGALAQDICPDKGSWAAWASDLPTGVSFNAGWYEFN